MKSSLPGAVGHDVNGTRRDDYNGEIPRPTGVIWSGICPLKSKLKSYEISGIQRLYGQH